MINIRALPHRPRVGAALVAVALLLVALGILGRSNPWALVWVDRLLGHVFVIGAVAALVCGLGMALVLGPSRWGTVALSFGALVAATWAAVGMAAAVLFSYWEREELAVVAAPQNLRGSDFEAVLRSDPGGVIDSAWTISIRQRGGLLAHEWQACYVEENPTIKHLYWESRRSLVVVTNAGDHRLAVNPRDGFPAEDQPTALCR